MRARLGVVSSFLSGLTLACGDQAVSTINAPPTATIVSPADGSAALEGRSVELRGTAADRDDAAADLQVTWLVAGREACPPGPPATDGSTLCVLAVAAGDTDISLTVTDPRGATSTDRITLSLTGSSGPAVTLTSPSPAGRYYADVPVTLGASLSDPDDPPAQLRLRWEDGTGAVRVPDAAPGADGTATASLLLAEGPAFLRAVATDPGGLTGTASVEITVGPPNVPPSCGIVSPDDGASAGLGELVVVRVSASDAEATPEELSVALESDLDGPLGLTAPTSGGEASFGLSALTGGLHRLRATVTDDAGATCTDEIAFRVSLPPTITVDSPSTGSSFGDDETIDFVATVADAESPPASLRVDWASSLDGALASGLADSAGLAVFSTGSLSPGTHVVTATVTDTDGLSTTRNLAVEVLDCGAIFWYLDADADGYGDAARRTAGCTAPRGYVGTGDDCDDSAPLVHPGMDERCGGVDEDCDGALDVGAVDALAWYRDADGDGAGDAAFRVDACAAPSGAWSLTDDDCDDAEPLAAPGFAEVCGDGVDNDCDGLATSCILTVDLGDAAVRFDGDAGADAAGTSVASIGDHDGDGIADLLIGAPDHDGGGSGAGAAFLVRSNRTGSVDLGLGSAAILTGAAAGDAAGSWVAPAGDIDADGYADILVGAPGNDGAATDAGAAYLLFGPLSGTAALSTAPAVYRGGAANDTLGAALAAVGDVTGDGQSDVLIGAWGDDTAASNAGAAYVFPASAGTRSATAATASFTGEQSSDFAGFRVAAAGDLDGDGIADLAIGAYAANPGGLNNAGTAYILYGPVSGATPLRNADGRLDGLAANDFVGRALAGVGDQDGDGRDDLLVGATGVDTTGAQAGAAYLWSGPCAGTTAASAAAATFHGESPGASAGRSVAAGGDLDGDGTPDLLIGADGEDLDGVLRGAAYLALGPHAGTTSLGDAYARLTGTNDEDGAALSVARVADLDADGRDEVLVGAPGVDLLAVGAGAAVLVHSSLY